MRTVLVNDPWANFKRREDPTARREGSIASASASTPSGSQSSTIAADPRLASLTARMDSYEKKHSDLAGKVGQLDTKIEPLGASMTEQFSQVMAGLRTLSENKEGNHPGVVVAASWGTTVHLGMYLAPILVLVARAVIMSCMLSIHVGEVKVMLLLPCRIVPHSWLIGKRSSDTPSMCLCCLRLVSPRNSRMPYVGKRGCMV